MAIIGYEDLGDGTNAVKVSIDGEAFAAALSGMEIDVSAVDIDALASAIDEALRTTPLDVSSDVTSSALPSGAATAAKQPALGTAGTPSADVLSVQGVSGGTPQPVSGPLTDTELRATDLPVTLPANTLATVNATIANGASLSGVVDIGEGKTLCAIDMPADWTAANLTFQASTASDGTFDNLYDQYGTEKTVTAAEDRYIPLDDPAFWLGVRYVKVRSGTAASAVNQGAERVITLVTKPV